MKTKFILIILCLFTSYACKNDKIELDLNYSNQKIIAVTVDLYIAGSAIQGLDELVADSLIEVYRSQIEIIHDVDIGLIEADIESLHAYPSLYKPIHKDILDSLSKLDKEVLIKTNNLNGK